MGLALQLMTQMMTQQQQQRQQLVATPPRHLPQVAVVTAMTLMWMCSIVNYSNLFCC